MEKSNEKYQESKSIDFDNIETLKGPKKIDIFNHLKLGIQYANKNCGCVHKPGTESNKYYCIPCKISCCPNCSLEIHQKHVLVKKSKYIINKKNITLMFEPIDYILDNNSLFTDSSLERNQLIKEVEDTYNILMQTVKDWKEFKEREIDNLFATLHKQVEAINKKKAEVKKQLLNFIESNEAFFNIK